jgi:hypothetical protein
LVLYILGAENGDHVAAILNLEFAFEICFLSIEKTMCAKKTRLEMLNFGKTKEMRERVTNFLNDTVVDMFQTLTQNPFEVNIIIVGVKIWHDHKWDCDNFINSC